MGAHFRIPPLSRGTRDRDGRGAPRNALPGALKEETDVHVLKKHARPGMDGRVLVTAVATDQSSTENPVALRQYTLTKPDLPKIPLEKP